MGAALSEAIAYFDADRVHQLLATGADANSITPDQGPALLDAVTWIPTSDNFTDAQIRAYSAQRRCIISDLVQHHADVNAPDSNGTTPLLAAVYANDYDTTALLLAHQADVNATDRQGDAPLVEAALNKNLPLTRLLLENHANANATDSRVHDTALSYAVANHDVFMASLLLRHHANPNLGAPEGRSLLVDAFPDLRLLRMLLDAGTDPNQRQPLLPPPLQGQPLAIIPRGSTVLIGFMEYELPPPPAAVINALKKVNQQGFGAMAVSGSWEFMPAFGQQKLMMTPESPAERRRVALLLDHGADVNAADADGWTPLMRAAFWGDLPLAKILLAHGAKRDARDNGGHTALDYARSADRQTMIHLLEAQ